MARRAPPRAGPGPRWQASAPPQARPSSSNSYLGHVGGPGGVGLIQTATTSSGTSFAWDDAAIGSGFTFGVLFLAAGAWLAARRRATLAHSNS